MNTTTLVNTQQKYSAASAVAKAKKNKHTKALITQTDQISYITTQFAELSKIDVKNID